MLIETPRLSDLLEGSLHYKKDKGKLKPQYPSICSFIGDTGAGKSTLSKSELCSGLSKVIPFPINWRY